MPWIRAREARNCGVFFFKGPSDPGQGQGTRKRRPAPRFSFLKRIRTSGLFFCGKTACFSVWGSWSSAWRKKSQEKVHARQHRAGGVTGGARPSPSPPPPPPRARAPRAPPRVARARAACRWGSQLRRTSCQDPPVGWVISTLGGSAAQHGLCAVQ
jgi:hypothetical protein